MVLLKGFRFGMLLQIAIGPVCLFILRSAAANGFAAAETGVVGVALADALFIFAAVFGLGLLLNKNRNVMLALKVFGAVILMVFGIANVLSVFHISILPFLYAPENQGSMNTFVYALILTLSNPLTVLFWAGVFSGKIAEDNMKRRELIVFGVGAVFSTLLFLTFAALTGTLFKAVLPQWAMEGLNLLVGLLLIFFGIKLLIKKS